MGRLQRAQGLPAGLWVVQRPQRSTEELPELEDLPVEVEEVLQVVEVAEHRRRCRCMPLDRTYPPLQKTRKPHETLRTSMQECAPMNDHWTCTKHRVNNMRDLEIRALSFGPHLRHVLALSPTLADS